MPSANGSVLSRPGFGVHTDPRRDSGERADAQGVRGAFGLLGTWAARYHHPTAAMRCLTKASRTTKKKKKKKKKTLPVS
eukprot:NODE_24000_length_642_cov_4.273786.p3 GENE.NODE_24000_length_642_cov_4.273786~~NODE_24000_length_642_cov_4.273786.p3  ORF type:complete len:79 (+),score=18.26 NODE_24000_length_642_cov_4.273786:300-536(+)